MLSLITQKKFKPDTKIVLANKFFFFKAKSQKIILLALVYKGKYSYSGGEG